MTRVKYFVKNLWTDEHLAQWIQTIMIVVNVALAAAIVTGGPERFVRPSYEPLIEFARGYTWVWGLALALPAILMTAPFKWPNALGLWLGMVWHILWAGCFSVAMINYANASSTAPIAYAGFAMIHAALLTARVTEDREE